MQCHMFHNFTYILDSFAMHDDVWSVHVSLHFYSAADPFKQLVSVCVVALQWETLVASIFTK